MKLKIIGDGSPKGTYIVDIDSGAELQKVEGFEWYLTPGNGNAWVRLKIADVFFDIDPANLFTPSSSIAKCTSPTMNLKIIGDGSEAGTYIVNAENEDVLEDISYQQWGYDDDVGAVVLNIEVSNVVMVINPYMPVSPSPPRVTISGSGSGTGTFSIPPSPPVSSSPGYIPANTYHPNGYSGAGSSSTLDPLLPGMPPDLLSMKSSSCIHEWVNVGFSSLKYVCRKCNVERDDS